MAEDDLNPKAAEDLASLIGGLQGGAAPPAFVEGDWPKLSRLKIRIIDLISHPPFMISERTFEDSQLWGPSILLPVGNIEFDGCTFDAPWEIIVIPAPAGRYLPGVIALKDVLFRRCAFSGVGIMLTAGNTVRISPPQ
jgi:hypothetical protein